MGSLLQPKPSTQQSAGGGISSYGAAFRAYRTHLSCHTPTFPVSPQGSRDKVCGESRSRRRSLAGAPPPFPLFMSHSTLCVVYFCEKGCRTSARKGLYMNCHRWAKGKQTFSQQKKTSSFQLKSDSPFIFLMEKGRETEQPNGWQPPQPGRQPPRPAAPQQRALQPGTEPLARPECGLLGLLINQT